MEYTPGDRLADAVIGDRIRDVEALLATGLKGDEPTRDGTTALHMAALYRDKKFAELLLKHGANVNVTNKYGKTPLMTAVEQFSPSTEIVELLLNSGADVKAQDEYGNTALQNAIYYENNYVILLLLAKGSQTMLPNKEGKTAMVRSGRYPEIWRLMMLKQKEYPKELEKAKKAYEDKRAAEEAAQKAAAEEAARNVARRARLKAAKQQRAEAEATQEAARKAVLEAADQYRAEAAAVERVPNKPEDIAKDTRTEVTIEGDTVRIFQAAVSDDQLEARLERTKPHSTTHGGKRLMNCTNLVMFLLGVVTKDEYLEICTTRGTITPYEEKFFFIREALKTCGRLGFVDVANSKPTSIDKLKEVADGLLPGYGTCLTMIPGGDRLNHSVFLWKNSRGELIYVDPQLSSPVLDAAGDPTYPIRTSGVDQIIALGKLDGYTSFKITISGPGNVIHAEDITCKADHLKNTPQGVFHLGGRRKKRRTRRQKKFRKTTHKRRK